MSVEIMGSVELAEKSGLTDAHIRRLLIAGKIAGQKIGRTWLISTEEAQRFINERNAAKARRRARWEKF